MARKADITQRQPFKRAFARSLRADPTQAERKLWAHLRAGRLGGLRFRRQQPIGPYIVDFFCPSVKLVIELDGSQHGADAHVAYDDARSRFLELRGYQVLRFWNGEVLKDIDVVLDAIWRASR